MFSFIVKKKKKEKEEYEEKMNNMYCDKNLEEAKTRFNVFSSVSYDTN